MERYTENILWERQDKFVHGVSLIFELKYSRCGMKGSTWPHSTNLEHTQVRAKTSMENDIDFRVRRCWVQGTDIPCEGDSTATKVFVLLIKNGDFPEAVKATKD